MAPVILRLRESGSFDVRVLATAQHREMLDQTLRFFGIQAEDDLDVMQPNQTLGLLTSRILAKTEELFAKAKPDVVLAQGETTTVLSLALSCFYHRIDFGHVEAGLRTGDLRNPFPEEANRVVAGKFARWHFAPTESAKNNLLREGARPNSVLVTGNTVIDALLWTASRIDAPSQMGEGKRLILVTAHRRENFGEPFREICRALADLAQSNPDIEILYPVHPNPNVKSVAHEMLGNVTNIRLCPPLDYAPFVAAMKDAYFIISDSGGVQEEAPALGKPVLVLRNETERPEAVVEGVVKLIGPRYEVILREAQKLLDDEKAYQAMARGVSPYGDGHAAERIVAKLEADMS